MGLNLKWRYYGIYEEPLLEAFEGGCVMRLANAGEKVHVVIDGRPYIIEQGDNVEILIKLRHFRGVQVNVSDDELKRLRKIGVLIPQNQQLF